MGTTTVTWLWLLPALPLLGALFHATLGRRLPNGVVTAVAVNTVFGSFGLAIAALAKLWSTPRLEQTLWPLFQFGEAQVSVALAVDHLSIVFVLLTTGVGTLIHLYASGYMAGDRGFARFFFGLNLFVFAMLVLVMAANPVLLFVGWEGVGLASWLLIGFWYEDLDNARAGLKAFITNRVGDVGMVLAVVMVLSVIPAGEASFLRLETAASAATSVVHAKLATPIFLGLPYGAIAALLFFWGAAAKSAQFPLFTWLPDAMAGPTPVSALIHAATMVTAGVYLVSRLSFLFALDARVGMVVAGAGAITAAIGALAASTQSDLKRVLAYSTVSQLGLMFVALGTGSYWAAVYHVVTHGFFKAALFLAAGSVIHATDHEQSLQRLGGLRTLLPRTAGVYLYGCLAIAGFPIAGGFFSKDAMLDGAIVGSAAWPPAIRFGVLTLAWLVALGTSFYAFRSYRLAFLGNYRGAGTPHEPSMRMTGVLIALAVLAAASIALGLWPVVGIHPAVESWLFDAGDDEPGVHLLAAVVAAASLALAAIGWLAARALYPEGWSPRAHGLRIRFRRAHRAMSAALGLDLAWQRLARAVVRLAAWLSLFDRVVIDGVVQLVAAVGRGVAQLENAVDQALFDGTVNLVGRVLQLIGRGARRLQTGAVPGYVFVAVAGVLVIAGVGLWLSGGLVP